MMTVHISWRRRLTRQLFSEFSFGGMSSPVMFYGHMKVSRDWVWVLVFYESTICLGSRGPPRLFPCHFLTRRVVLLSNAWWVFDGAQSLMQIMISHSHSVREWVLSYRESLCSVGAASDLQRNVLWMVSAVRKEDAPVPKTAAQS